MDYDDDEFQGRNFQLAGEGSSKFSPVLRSYALPKFDFDDTLHGQLNFNSLVESGVFLGQEDNHWIEVYSIESSGIEFNSSGVESRHNNVWSEATSSESVEMLLKSVGQEEKVVGEAETEQLDPDICDETVSLTKIMDPNLKQESQISGGELDSVVINEKHNLSVLEEKVDNKFDDVILKESNKNRVSSSENAGASIEEFNAITLSKNVSTGAAEENIQIKKNNIDVPLVNDTMIVKTSETNISYGENPSTETCITFSGSLPSENSIPSVDNLSDKTSFPFSENPPTETSIPFCEIPTTETSIQISENPSPETSIPFGKKAPAENSIPFSESLSQALMLKDPDSPKSNAGSLSKISPIKISSIQENKTVIEKDAQQIISDTSMVSAGNLPETGCESSGSVQVDCKITSSEPGAVHLDQAGSFSEKEDACLALESNDMNFEVVQAADGQKNFEPSLLLERSKETTTYNFDSDASVLVERVSGQRSSPDTATAENDEQPKSPIFGVSLVHQGSKKNTKVGCSFEGNTQNEFSKDESVAASVAKNPSVLVEKEASPDLAVKVVYKIDHCVVRDKNYNASQIEQEPRIKKSSQDCFKKLDTKPFESQEETCSNSQTDGLQDPKESMIEDKHKVWPAKSNEHQTSVDVAHPFDITDNVHNVSQSVSLDKATPEEKNITFEVTKRADLGKDNKDYLSSPTVHVSNLPEITDKHSKDASSNQMDLKKSDEVSVRPQNPSGLTSQVGVKGKSERKPRRKSAGKENTMKGTAPARDSVRGQISPVLLIPPSMAQVTRSEEDKSHEIVTKPGVLSSPKIPDLNNSTSIFQQPFTDNQQVQLRAQILVYGSLISGSPPEETHMIAAFGQSDGGRTWDGVWRACLERLHCQKSLPKSSMPIQSLDAGIRSDQINKHASNQNKVPSSPIGGPNNKGTPPFVSPMIPFSSSLWNTTTPSHNLHSSGMAKTAYFDYHQTLSPLHPTYQTPPPPILNYNSSWLSQGPFSGQWLASSPIPTFNPTPRFPSLPITESVKLTPVKESGGSVVKVASNPVVINSAPIIIPEVSSVSGMKRSFIPSDQPSVDAKSRKKKKDTSLVSIPCSTSVSVSVPVFIESKSSPAKFLATHHTKGGDQGMDKVVILEETSTKVGESKLQAKEAAEHANNAMFHCNGVWSQVQRHYNYDLNSNDEAKLVSSAVSIAAAASVAKVAATAAKIASDVAEQTRLMVNELNKIQNLDQIKAASASSKYAENLDAIVKAAELAAEAVSQAGKIVAMSEPFSLRELIEAGPEGYWKTPRLASKQQSLIAKNLNVIERRNAETAPDKGVLATISGGDLMKNQTIEVDGASAPFTSHEKDKRKSRPRKGLEVFKTFGTVTDSEIGSVDTSIAGQAEPKICSGNLKESDIKEGCLVEVYKDEDKYNSAWFGAKVLSLKDGKALVSYTEIQSDEVGSGKFKEWLPLEAEGSEVPKIRLAHPVTTMQGTRKRRRTAATDFMWSSGDRVDVWIQNHWREGVVMETNKIDTTLLTVQFPGKGETLVVRSWFVRPTLIWKDGKWVMCPTSEKQLSSPGNMPQEKRFKLGSPIVESKRKAGPSENTDLDLRKQEESRPLSLSTHDSVFNVGSTRDNKVSSQRTMRRGSQKEGPGVIFGVPKPGKKQKFMDVSKHYVNCGSNITTHDSIKFTRYLIPNPPGSRGWKNNSRSGLKEKQATETKPQMVKSRKPPVPSVRTLFTKSTNNKSSLDSVSDGENQSGQQTQMEHGSSSGIENKSERLNKRKFTPTASGKTTKIEKSLPEIAEPRRSIRKIQPTSRLLEGLQSSMTISKMPALSHSTQRSHNKLTPKGTMAEEKDAPNNSN
ncbi:hypothetical protein E3N88_25192 [Mikania micrantha]|uniref:Agenet domain-containing protein n=1 Tax=Mikania micrantha TaxID=192012 RepID=A0A5N6N4A9_9ASTR|nr:hypothetical protein E3N88_25192 [Mikania micrantha]